MKKNSINALIILIITLHSYAQISPLGVFSFLELPTAARQTALGSNFLSSYKTDVSLSIANPSMLDSTYKHHLSLNYLEYVGDVNIGSLTYANFFKKFGSFAFSILYSNYGTFTEADETGQIYGEFTASDHAIIVGWGRSLSDFFRIGANLKSVFSNYYQYYSYGLCFDVAVSFIIKEHKFSSTLLLQNAGRQIKPYISSRTESLPFRIHLTTQKQLQYVPLTLYFTLHNLQKWDLTYHDTSQVSQTNPFDNNYDKKIVEETLNKIMHHIIIGMEFSPFQNAYLRLGYNYHRRKEMIVPTRLSTVGISWGFGFKIYKIHLNYARSKYHLSSTPNVITLTTTITDWLPSALSY